MAYPAPIRNTPVARESLRIVNKNRSTQRGYAGSTSKRAKGGARGWMEGSSVAHTATANPSG
jgi:hypothetical protein